MIWLVRQRYDDAHRALNEPLLTRNMTHKACAIMKVSCLLGVIYKRASVMNLVFRLWSPSATLSLALSALSRCWQPMARMALIRAEEQYVSWKFRKLLRKWNLLKSICTGWTQVKYKSTRWLIKATLSVTLVQRASLTFWKRDSTMVSVMLLISSSMKLSWFGDTSLCVLLGGDWLDCSVFSASIPLAMDSIWSPPRSRARISGDCPSVASAPKMVCAHWFLHALAVIVEGTRRLRVGNLPRSSLRRSVYHWIQN